MVSLGASLCKNPIGERKNPVEGKEEKMLLYLYLPVGYWTKVNFCSNYSVILWLFNLSKQFLGSPGFLRRRIWGMDERSVVNASSVSLCFRWIWGKIWSVSPQEYIQSLREWIPLPWRQSGIQRVPGILGKHQAIVHFLRLSNNWTFWELPDPFLRWEGLRDDLRASLSSLLPSEFLPG